LSDACRMRSPKDVAVHFLRSVGPVRGYAASYLCGFRRVNIRPLRPAPPKGSRRSCPIRGHAPLPLTLQCGRSPEEAESPAEHDEMIEDGDWESDPSELTVWCTALVRTPDSLVGD